MNFTNLKSEFFFPLLQIPLHHLVAELQHTVVFQATILFLGKGAKCSTSINKTKKPPVILVLLRKF